MEFKYREIQNGFLVELSYEDPNTVKTVDKTVDKTVGKSSEDIILDAIKVNPEVTRRMLVEITGLTRRGVEWNMKKLKERNIIRRVGGRKTGYWEILLDN